MEKDMQYYVKVSGDVMLENIGRRKELTGKLVEEYFASGREGICLVASGSSLNAALTAELFMSRYTGVRVTILSPTEYMYYRKEQVRDDFMIVVSQSGCSTNIIEAVMDMKQDKIMPVALTGNREGSLKKYVDTLIEYGVGRETVGYVTLGMTTLVEFLILAALEIAMERNNISEGEYRRILEEMKVCCRANKVAYQKAEIFTHRFYEELFRMDRVILVADGANMGVIREAGLKFGETLKIPTLFYESEEYVHGPDMQLTPAYSVFFIDTNPNTDRMYDIFQATAEVTPHVYFVTNKNIEPADNVISLPATVRTEITPLFTVVLFQYICAVVTREKNNFQCHPFFEKFEKRIKIKTEEYREENNASEHKTGKA